MRCVYMRQSWPSFNVFAAVSGQRWYGMKKNQVLQSSGHGSKISPFCEKGKRIYFSNWGQNGNSPSRYQIQQLIQASPPYKALVKPNSQWIRIRSAIDCTCLKGVQCESCVGCLRQANPNMSEKVRKMAPGDKEKLGR